MGYLVYNLETTMFAVSFDIDKLETRGTPVPVLDDVAYSTGSGGGQFNYSASGTLVYRRAAGNLPAKTGSQPLWKLGRTVKLTGNPQTVGWRSADSQSASADYTPW
jgi:hypothetical protein